MFRSFINILFSFLPFVFFVRLCVFCHQFGNIFFSTSSSHSNAKRTARSFKPPGWIHHFTRFRCVHCGIVGVLRFIGRIFIFIAKHISVLGCGVYAYFDFIFCFFFGLPFSPTPYHHFLLLAFIIENIFLTAFFLCLVHTRPK